MRDLNDLFHRLDEVEVPDFGAEVSARTGDAEPRMPTLGGWGNRTAVIVFALVVFLASAVLAFHAFLATGPVPGHSPTPTMQAVAPGTQVFFSWPGLLTSVDAATGKVSTVAVPELDAGDPVVDLARIGDRLALWGYDTYTIDPTDLNAPAVRITRGSWFFVPSATPGRIWAVWKDEGASTPHRFVFSHVREVDASSGAVTVDGTAPGEGWLDGAVIDGPIFETRDGLIVWDPVAEKVIARIDASSAAATFGNTVAWCDNHCPILHFTDVRTGNDRSVEPPSEYPFFYGWSGVFSPDGSTFAVPVWSSSSGRHRSAVALIDTSSGTIDALVPGSASRDGCCDLSWDSTGQRLYYGRFSSDGHQTGWKLSYWDIGLSRSVDIPVDIPHAVAMVAN